ncbi:uncharacterized protein EAE97_006197 [Botrytis byssoidea]|uniref:SAP domain-containing protein n=1 Tax=Botrytis byssoidea TaxID=139641 RepID=A0A9P5M2M2_9HELO|nr:uncharacterized protein EAE97_006197 [Botrytis byssoidea]KAF7942743.1 hypothetical protein EAE97_006197 [Botrytis byssoidea]
MNNTEASASKKRGNPKSSTDHQTPNKGLLPAADEITPKKKAMQGERAATPASKVKRANRGGISTNTNASTSILMNWLRSGKSTNAAASYVEKDKLRSEAMLGSEDQLGFEDMLGSVEGSVSEEREATKHNSPLEKDEPPSKRQKQSDAAPGGGNLISSPGKTPTTPKKNKTSPPKTPRKTTTPREKKTKSPKSPKIVTPKEPERVKPPKGVIVRTEYIANPAAVFIPPIEITHEDLADFTLDGEGELVYQGERNKDDGLLYWSLNHRIVSEKYDRPEAEYFEPPKETLKKWRAYCAFRGLNTSGTREEMQERLKDYFEFVERIEITDQDEVNETNENDEPITEPERLREIIEAERHRPHDPSWRIQNEAERTRLWSLLSTEQQFEKNISLFITENITNSKNHDVWVFKTRPKFTVAEWFKFFEQHRSLDIGLAFTIPPESLTSEDKSLEMKYQRGKMVVVPFTKIYWGGTWVATGFEKGMVLARTQTLVKQKLEEMCEEIRKRILGRYITDYRNAVTLPANSSRSSNTSTWTVKEEQQAQALWNIEDANKKSSDLTYQFGKVVKEKVSSPIAAA